MASTVYDVRVRYMTDDRASRGLRNIERAASRTTRSTDRLGKSLRRIATGVAAWQGFRVAKSFLIDYNSQLEQARVQMGGLLMLNMGGNWAANQKRANALVRQFTEDAKKSVATTQDFVKFASNITGPLAQAGASMEQIRKITKGGVVAAGAFGISGEMAGLDIQQALMGNLGSKDRFARMLGLDPASWNKMVKENPEKAIPGLIAAFNQPAIKQMAKAQANTFAGQWSTLKDNIQRTLGKVGVPLMKALTAEFSKISTWFENNPEKVNAIAKSIANALIKGFGVVKSAFKFLYDNRELIMTLAKAMLAFKAVKAVTSGIGGIAGSLVGLGGGAGTATTALGRFGAKLPGIAAGLTALHGAASGIANSILARQEKQIKNDVKYGYRRSRARALSGDYVGDKAKSQVEQIQREALRRGYRDDAGAVVAGTRSSGGRTIRRKQATAGIATAADKLMASDLLRSMIADSFDKGVYKSGSLAKAGKIRMSHIMAQQRVGAGQHQARMFKGQGPLDMVLAAMKKQGFKGGLQDIGKMTPQEVMSLIGTEFDNLTKALPDKDWGDDFIHAIRGTSNALKMNAEAIQRSVMQQTINDVMDKAAAFLNEQAAKGKKGTKASSSRNTNVTIRKIEVVSDDPDRFAMNLVGAFQDFVKSPSQAASAINER